MKDVNELVQMVFYVGLAILGPLQELDVVAYLRFASVYRAFDSLEDFEAAITELGTGCAAFKIRRQDMNDGVAWERRDIVMTNRRDRSVSFEKRDIELPDFWYSAVPRQQDVSAPLHSKPGH